jgi:DNA-binding transcriptional LysR family regulator
MRLPPHAIGPQDLAGLHIVLSAPPSRLHQTITAWMADAGCRPTRLSTCNNLSVIVDMVASGLAVAVLPMSAVRRDVAAGRIRRLDVRPAVPNHPAALCYRRGNDSPGLGEVARIVEDLVGEHRLFLPGV